MKTEIRIYKALQGGAGIPKLYDYKTEGGYNIMVMQLLGPSLESLFKKCDKRFSIATGLVLADQMVVFPFD